MAGEARGACIIFVGAYNSRIVGGKVRKSCIDFNIINESSFKTRKTSGNELAIDRGSFFNDKKEKLR